MRAVTAGLLLTV